MPHHTTIMWPPVLSLPALSLSLSRFPHFLSLSFSVSALSTDLLPLTFWVFSVPFLSLPFSLSPLSLLQPPDIPFPTSETQALQVSLLLSFFNVAITEFLFVLVFVHVEPLLLMGCFQSKTAHLHSPDDPSAIPEPTTKPDSGLHFFYSVFAFFPIFFDHILKNFVGFLVWKRMEIRVIRSIRFQRLRSTFSASFAKLLTVSAATISSQRAARKLPMSFTEENLTVIGWLLSSASLSSLGLTLNSLWWGMTESHFQFMLCLAKEKKRNGRKKMLGVYCFQKI